MGLSRFYMPSSLPNNPMDFVFGQSNNISISIIPKTDDLCWVSNILPKDGKVEITTDSILITTSLKDLSSNFMASFWGDNRLENCDYEIGEIKITTNNEFVKHNRITLLNPINSYNTDFVKFETVCATSDLVIFITSATFCCTKDENELIELIPREKLVIVVNRMDVINPKEVNDIKEYIGNIWSKKSSYPINYISVLQALDSMKDKDLDRYISSGIPYLFTSLRLNFKLLV